MVKEQVEFVIFLWKNLFIELRGIRDESRPRTGRDWTTFSENGGTGRDGTGRDKTVTGRGTGLDEIIFCLSREFLFKRDLFPNIFSHNH